MKLRKQPHHEDLEFQIAPMIDVLLTLLVFFVSITSASVLRSEKNLTLPVAAMGTEKKAARLEAIVNVRWLEGGKGLVTMEDVPYENLDLMVSVLEPRWKANNSYRAVIRADRQTPALFVQKVMTACAQAGISDISFSVINRE